MSSKDSIRIKKFKHVKKLSNGIDPNILSNEHNKSQSTSPDSKLFNYNSRYNSNKIYIPVYYIIIINKFPYLDVSPTTDWLIIKLNKKTLQNKISIPSL